MSVLGADERRPGRGPHAWREAIQARRSALILAPDRETAVTYALAWSLDLSKIRLGTDVSSNRRRELAAELDAASIRERPWHSRG